MCICASETSRPRLFNWVTVVLVSVWVLLVSAVAHTFPSTMDGAGDAGRDIAAIEATLLELVDRLAVSIPGI